MSRLVDAASHMVSNAELHLALQQSLNRYFGDRRSIIKLERRHSAYRTSFALEELDAHLDDGRTLQLMFKNLGRQALPDDVRGVKPDFLYEPLREIQTYRAILSSARLGTATCYGTAIDPERDRYWLFIEKVPGVELYQLGELSVWQQAAGWLAGMHWHFNDKIELLTKTTPLLIHDAGFYWQWLRRAQVFSSQIGVSRIRNAHQRIEWLAERYHRVVEHLVSMPAIFIHGEFYASNVLVQGSESDVRVCPIDWEMAAVGPGLIDLAALIAGKWTEEEKTIIARGYYAALPPESGWYASPDAFMVDLEYCQLALAVQWLGWSPAWSPPAEHTHDWLSDAVHLAEKLSL